ncbi:MAG: transporter substrate-binding domain-containing protein [Neisseriaceae bacterium]|nr:transporter substrate-binding domain-containing protein [Neisseriaceae bacterium]
MKRRYTSLLSLSLVTLLLTSLSIPASAGQRLDHILASKTLRVGTPGDYRPFAMLQDGQYSGFDVDLIQQMAAEMGVTVEFVATTWPKLMADFDSNRFDVALGGISRNVNRVIKSDFLPGYAPFGKVALIRAADKAKYTTAASLNQPAVRVIKNPGGTNEQYVLANLGKAQVSTHPLNAEIPGLIAAGKGDVMITETYEALLYAKQDPRLYAAFIDQPLTKVNTLGFMLQKDDPDFVRTMHFVWGLLDSQGALQKTSEQWLK